MKPIEFCFMMVANVAKTTNLRINFNPWPPFVEKLPDELSANIGCIIALVQAKINEGYLCNKVTECLSLYDVESISSEQAVCYYTLCATRESLLKNPNAKEGKGPRIQLIVDVDTGEVINAPMAMLRLGLITKRDIDKERLETPISYGNYHHYDALCHYIAIESPSLLSDYAFFKGDYDRDGVIQKGSVFGDLPQARQFLAASKAVGRYLVEVGCSEQDIERLKAQGLGKKAAKFIDYAANTVVVNSTPAVILKERALNDQLDHLLAAFGMTETLSSRNKRARLAITIAASKTLCNGNKPKPFAKGAPLARSASDVCGLALRAGLAPPIIPAGFNRPNLFSHSSIPRTLPAATHEKAIVLTKQRHS